MVILLKGNINHFSIKTKPYKQFQVRVEIYSQLFWTEICAANAIFDGCLIIEMNTEIAAYLSVYMLSCNA